MLGIAVLLGGCSTPNDEKSDPPGGAQSLWADRTDFVGDNSRVAALVDHTGFGPAGTYALSLQSKQTPYSITVAFDHLDKPFVDIDFSAEATLVLGLVANLDAVTVTSDDSAYALTASEASAALGFDVKELGRDQTMLAEYLDRARD